jgi:protein SCO1/2
VNARRAFVAASLAALVLAASGCDKLGGGSGPQFHGVDVTGTEAGGNLRLEDYDGKPRTLADFRGKVVLVTFGYTHCPDVCPTTLHDYAVAMKKLGPEASRVQMMFVSVDPKRDTPAVLKEYVHAFDPSFLALHGDEAATERATRDFHVYAKAEGADGSGNYAVEHASQVFVFDPQGKLRLMIPAGTKSDDIAADLRLLLA